MTTAAITPGYAGHIDADLLAALATEIAPMQLAALIAFGTQADAENAVGSRVFFIPKMFRAMPRKLQPVDGNASFDDHRVYTVAVYATDAGGLYRLWSALVDKLDILLSWTGFEAGDTSEPKGAGAGNSGFALTFPVTIKGPGYREVYGSTTVETVAITTMIAEADGSGAEELPL